MLIPRHACKATYRCVYRDYVLVKFDGYVDRRRLNTSQRMPNRKLYAYDNG